MMAAIRLVTTALFAFIALAGTSLAQGVAGRASLNGVLGEKIEIRAYAVKGASFGPFTGEKIAAKTTVRPDGFFMLDLPPGRYVVDGIWKKAGNSSTAPEVGDGYCVYSGSPVNVVAGKNSAVGLYLTEVKPEGRAPSDTAAIRGSLTFKGKPIERTYLYLYSTTADSFRGPADFLQPVEAGRFDLRVAPGKYYLVARKRLQGGSYGPISTGDLFNFYPLNPVTVKAGERVEIEIPLIEKLSQTEETGVYKGVRIVVTDPNGRPLEKHFALAYTDEARTGHPAGTAGPTGPEGSAFLNAPPEARFLRVRKQIGGPPEEGETYTDATIPAGAGEVRVVFTGKGGKK